MVTKYKTNDNANIRVFKPNTINSSFLILIPSSESIPEDLKQDTPWFLKSNSESEKMQKIDLMVGESGDLIFTPNEDVQLSFGLENAMQAIKLKLAVEAGELEKHPGYGLVGVQGQKNNNTSSLEAFLAEIIDSSISGDSRFERVENLEVKFFNGKNSKTGTGNGFNVKLNVRLAGSDSTIPITFSVDL